MIFEVPAHPGHSMIYDLSKISFQCLSFHKVPHFLSLQGFAEYFTWNNKDLGALPHRKSFQIPALLEGYAIPIQSALCCTKVLISLTSQWWQAKRKGKRKCLSYNFQDNFTFLKRIPPWLFGLGYSPAVSPDAASIPPRWTHPGHWRSKDTVK